MFGALRHNPVLAARHAQLTGRAGNPLSDAQARTALGASLLRQLHAVLTRGVAWDPAIAAGAVDPPPGGDRRRRIGRDELAKAWGRLRN